MAKYHRFIPLLVISLVSVAFCSVSFAQSDNLLTNPGFEAPYTDEGGNPPRQVANGWDAWHLSRTADQPDFQNVQPEYSATLTQGRVRSGNDAQQYESFFATHTGGVTQVVSGVEQDVVATFGVYVWVWSSRLDDEDVSEDDGDVLVDVGIDPTGGTDPTSDDIVWSVATEQYDEYVLYTVSAITESDIISVWVRSRVGFAAKTSRIHLDDAFLTVEVGEDTPEPTETEEVTPDPTNTPTQEPTLEPTEAEAATSTRDAPATPTPEVVIESPEFDTPVPTATSAPISEQFPETITHTVARGDTVSALATRYESTIGAIQQANGLDAVSLIFVGQQLVVPVSDTSVGVTATPSPTSLVIVITATPSGVTTPVPPTGSGNTYVIQSGDTLSSVARQFNTTVAAIAQLNGIVNADRIFSGQALVVPASTSPVTVVPPTAIPSTPVPIATVAPIVANPDVYVVQPGDNLFRISLRFGISVSDLIRANGIVNANQIFTGQQLIIP